VLACRAVYAQPQISSLLRGCLQRDCSLETASRLLTGALLSYSCSHLVAPFAPDIRGARRSLPFLGKYTVPETTSKTPCFTNISSTWCYQGTEQEYDNTAPAYPPVRIEFFNNGSAPGKPGLEDMETRSNAAEDTAADGNAGAKGQLKSLLMRTKAAGHNSSQW
jgi:hypothetical protein